MWYERFVIIVPSLSHEFEPWQWAPYAPTYIDWAILLGSFGWFSMWFLLFVKQLPVMAIAEIKEIVPPRMRQPVSRLSLDGHGETPGTGRQQRGALMRGIVGVFPELDSRGGSDRGAQEASRG